jgi:hypothetical protein
MAKLSWLPKMRGALDGGDRLLAGVDEVGIDVVFGRERANAQHAVLALQPDFDVGGHVIGHQRGNADAKVDVIAVVQFAGGARRHLVLCPRHDYTPAFSVMVRFSMRFSGFGLCTMRCT